VTIVMEEFTTGEPSSDQQIAEAFGENTPRSAWRILGRNKARVVYGLLREAENGDLGTKRLLEATLIRECVYRAVSAASNKYRDPRQRLMDWFSGAAIETTWSELHQAEQRLLLVQPVAAVQSRVDDILAALKSNLKADDARLAPATTRLTALRGATHDKIDEAREELRTYQQWADDAGDEAHANVRSLRNLLIAIGGCVVVVLVVLGTLNWVSSGFLNLSGPTTSSKHSIGVWEIEAIAALGGMIAAIFTIAKLGGFGGPYRLPVYQALIRVPAGAAVGLAAVTLTQSGLITALKPESGLGVLAVALIFGYSPDVFLRFIDQKAATLLGQAQSKDDPSATSPVASTSAGS
jgi:hypothetical protein